jgi:predicted dithiol-disulfide oxidoreductase (DUF899 family)
MNSVRFPNESADYRKARNELLRAEKKLRKQIEAVAALRRTLPLGGEVKEDYVFDEGPAKKVKLSQLFEAKKKPTLVVYSFMYGPNMESACPMCTSMLDGLNGSALHARQVVNLAVVAKSPIPRIQKFAKKRGWDNLRLLSSANNTYNRDYYGEDEEGYQNPVMNVFTKRGKKIHHFYSTELLFTPSEPGQDSRHIDLLWPLWNLLDLTPEGRGEDWYPDLEY